MSFVATVLQNLRFTRRENGHRVDQHELRSRAGNTGFLELFKSDTELLLGSGLMGIPEMVANHSDERNFRMVVMDKGTVNKQGARSCTINVQQNDSQILTITLITLAYDFNMLPQQLWNGGKGNNEISYAEDFEQKIVNIEDDVLISIEDSAIAAAIGYQTLTAAFDSQTPYAIASNAMQVPVAEHLDFLNSIDPIVSLHAFGKGALNITSDTIYERSVRRFSEPDSLKLSGDATNAIISSSDSEEAWMLANKTFRATDRLPAILNVSNRVFASVPGTFGLVTNNPPAFQTGETTTGGVRFEETGPLPLSGFSMGHQFKTDCLNGKEIQEFHQFSLNYAVITAHNSAPATEPSALFEAHLRDNL